MKEIIPKDFIKAPLEVNDWVVFVELGYRNFLIGKINRMTAKTLWITHIPTNFGSKETKQEFSQVLKIDVSQVPEKYKGIP